MLTDLIIYIRRGMKLKWELILQIIVGSLVWIGLVLVSLYQGL